MLNIKNLEARETFDVVLKYPNGVAITGADGTPCSVTVYGPGSRVALDVKRQRQERLKALLKAKKDRNTAAGTKDETLTYDEQRAENAEYLAGVTKQLNGFTYGDGSGVAGQEMLLAFYGNPALDYITDQVASAAMDWANFTNAPSAT